MKIYFEDGELRTMYQLPIKDYFKVDASKGYSENIKDLDIMRENNYNATVYTNQIAALSSTYCWESALQVPELYIRAGEHMLFTRIDKLTNRQLREGHNLMKMYINGEFSGKSDITELNNIKNSVIEILQYTDYMEEPLLFANMGRRNPDIPAKVLFDVLLNMVESGEVIRRESDEEAIYRLSEFMK